MNYSQKNLSIVDCQQAVHSFYLSLDACDFKTVANLMASDGIWHRQGKELKGPLEVLQALSERPKGRVTAHMVQNLVVHIHNENQASASYLCLVYRCDLSQPSSEPAPMQPLSILRYDDTFVKNASGQWLLKSKRSQRIFEA